MGDMMRQKTSELKREDLKGIGTANHTQSPEDGRGEKGGEAESETNGEKLVPNGNRDGGKVAHPSKGSDGKDPPSLAPPSGWLLAQSWRNGEAIRRSGPPGRGIAEEGVADSTPGIEGGRPASRKRQDRLGTRPGGCGMWRAVGPG